MAHIYGHGSRGRRDGARLSAAWPEGRSKADAVQPEVNHVNLSLLQGTIDLTHQPDVVVRVRGVDRDRGCIQAREMSLKYVQASYRALL